MSDFSSAREESSAAASSSSNSNSSNEHMLKFRWAFYMHKKTRIDDYKKNTRKLFEFSTVEDFWRKWQSVPMPR